MRLIRPWQYSYANKTPTKMLKKLSESPVEVQSLQHKEKKKRKSKGEKKFDFCACPSQNVLKGDAGGKKGKLSCCKCLLDRLKLIWPIFSLKIFTMSKKRCFWPKNSGGKGSMTNIRTISINKQWTVLKLKILKCTKDDRLQNRRNFLRILVEWRQKGGEHEARVAREGRSVKNPACPHTIVQALPPLDTPSMTT